MGVSMDTSNGTMRSRDLAGLPRARPHIDPHVHDTNARLKSGRKASHRARRGGRRARRTLVCGPARKKGDEYDGGKSRVRRAAGGALTEFVGYQSNQVGFTVYLPDGVEGYFPYTVVASAA